MAARSSSSVTMSRTRCAACPSGTNSCTEGGSSHASFTRHGRKLFVVPPSESPPTAEDEPLWPYRDTLRARKALAERPSWITAHRSLVMALVLLGRGEEAAAAARRYRELAPA